ncbi:MAG: ComEA family DNA-binding protein [Desulfotomaculaceae bacterium]
MERKHQLVLLIMAALILFGAGFKYAQVRGDQANNNLIVTDVSASGAGETNHVDEKELKPQEIMVHVAGQVQHPGVYRLTADSRVVDAVNLAGPTDASALDYLNLAAPLQDGSQIIVYGKDELGNQALPAGSPLPKQQLAGFVDSSGLININTAGQAQLEELPGIGPALAQRIIDHRTKNGPFLSTEDIMAVSGIGEKRYEQLKDIITVY